MSKNIYLGAGSFRLLNENKCEGDNCALSDEILFRVQQRLDQGNRLLNEERIISGRIIEFRYLVTGARTGNSESHCSPIADVAVEVLDQHSHITQAQFRVTEENNLKVLHEGLS